MRSQQHPPEPPPRRPPSLEFPIIPGETEPLVAGVGTLAQARRSAARSKCWAARWHRFVHNVQHLGRFGITRWGRQPRPEITYAFLPRLPCPRCGSLFTLGWTYVTEEGTHAHTRYVCRSWPARSGNPCGWTGWTLTAPTAGDDPIWPVIVRQEDWADWAGERFKPTDDLEAKVAASLAEPVRRCRVENPWDGQW